MAVVPLLPVLIPKGAVDPRTWRWAAPLNSQPYQEACGLDDPAPRAGSSLRALSVASVLWLLLDWSGHSLWASAQLCMMPPAANRRTGGVRASPSAKAMEERAAFVRPEEVREAEQGHGNVAVPAGVLAALGSFPVASCIGTSACVYNRCGLWLRAQHCYQKEWAVASFPLLSPTVSMEPALWSRGDQDNPFLAAQANPSLPSPH